jgi:hypothetical protein
MEAIGDLCFPEAATKVDAKLAFFKAGHPHSRYARGFFSKSGGESIQF